MNGLANGAAGFSLVETMVALFVFALAGVGLVELQAHSLSTLGRVETRTLAAIAAQNTLVDGLAGASLTPGTDEIYFAGRRWRRTTEVTGTQAPRVSRVTVRIDPADGAYPGAAAHAFLVSPS